MRIKTKISFIGIICVGLALTQFGQAQTVKIPNASFEEGANGQPLAWTSHGGAASWENEGRTGNHSISVTGSSENSAIYWRNDEVKLEPHTLYQMSFWAKTNGGSGSIISGMSNANHDFAISGTDWQKFSFFFMAPENVDDVYLRLGRWSISGKVYFDDVVIEKAVPIFHQSGDLALGDGESVSNNIYTYQPNFMESNYGRSIEKIAAGFNTNRWPFSKGASLIHRHQVDSKTQKSAEITTSLKRYYGGKMIIDASQNGENWTEIGSMNETGSTTVKVPDSFFPAKVIYTRLRAADATSDKGDSSPGSFQLGQYSYTAQLQEDTPDAQGSTSFVVAQENNPDFNVKIESFGQVASGKNTLKLHVTNPQHVALQTNLTLRHAREKTQKFSTKSTSEEISLPYQFGKAGTWLADLEVTQGDKTIYAASTQFAVPVIHTAGFGLRLGDDLWWAKSTNKVGQNRPMPLLGAEPPNVPIQLARNEYEAAQIIVHPSRDISQVMVKVSDLTGENGAKIDKSQITVDEVAYVPVQQPTDNTGAVGNWPDPLPPLKNPIDLKANQNQPFWITVYAPKETPAGIYTGKVLLSGENWQREVDLRVRVWDFTLSDTPHIKSALGMDDHVSAKIAPYHKISKDQLREVKDKYFANFSTHRISAYRPLYGASMKVDWGLSKNSDKVTADQVTIDTAQFDKEMQNAIDKYHITTIRYPGFPGAGHRNGDKYVPGKVGKYVQGTPEYEILFGSFVKQMQDHLEEKGWLEKVLFYWIDEPTPAVYKGIGEMGDIIHKHAPKLQWLLTANHDYDDPALSSVGIFTPLISKYDHKAATEAEAQGKEFWWYIATGPKAPYIGQFIDRPGIEPRLWLWQTWKNNVRGILIWDTTVWTSPAAYPDSLQNPWEDTMSWSTSAGTPWGNGDGRWLYPPRRDPNTATTANFDAPINSTRWENLRDGMEDYEYLWMLQQQVNKMEQLKSVNEAQKEWLSSAKVLLQVPDSISKSLTDFSSDATALLSRRTQIAQTIEAGQKLLP